MLDLGFIVIGIREADLGLKVQACGLLKTGSSILETRGCMGIQMEFGMIRATPI